MGNVSLSHCFLELEHASVIGRYGGPHEAHVTGPLPQCLECMSWNWSKESASLSYEVMLLLLAQSTHSENKWDIKKGMKDRRAKE